MASVEQLQGSGNGKDQGSFQPISETSQARLETHSVDEHSLCLWSDQPKMETLKQPLSLLSPHKPVRGVCAGCPSLVSVPYPAQAR